jgi:glycosyltransferase involved in cell wall biosynthesis
MREIENKIRVLHISGADIQSGAGKGAYWLHKGLVDNGLDSIFLSPGINKNTQYEIFINPTVLKTKSRIEKLKLLLHAPRHREQYSTGEFGIDIEKIIKKENPNIIHLHWINNSAVNIRDLRKINLPIIWTVRDMWPFTGGCHYSLDCQNYKTKCGHCRILKKPNIDDISKIIYQKKEHISSKIHYVFISRWLQNEGEKTNIIQKSASINYIPNNVDSDLFKYTEKNKARNALKINKKDKIILCGSVNLNDTYKGYKYIKTLSKALKNSNISFFSFGKNDEAPPEFNYNFGKVTNEKTLSTIYAASDCYLMPSIQEAFGKTAVESILCGVPVIAFKNTGIEDIIKHKVNGFLAEYKNENSLLEGIDWALNHFSQTHRERQKISTTVSNFETKNVSKLYIDLYKKILNRY